MSLDFVQTDTNAPFGAIAACSGLDAGSAVIAKLAQVGGTPGSTEVTATHATSAGGTRRLIHFELEVPADTTWAAGDWTVRFATTTSSAQLNWDTLHICRVDSSGVSQDTIASTSGLGIKLNDVSAETTVAGIAQTPSADDRVYIVIGVTNNQTMSNSVGVTPSAIISSPFEAAAGPFTLSHTFNAGTQNNTVVANPGGGDDAFDELTIQANATLTYDEVSVADGMAARYEPTDTTSNAARVGWTVDPITGDVFCRMALRFDANPPIVFMRLFDSSTTILQVAAVSTGEIQFRNGDASTIFTTTKQFAAGDRVRIEAHYVVSTRAVEARFWWTQPMSDGSPDETQSGTGTTTVSAIDTAWFGAVAANANQVAYWFDDLGLSDDTWIGPSTPAVEASGGLAAGSGSALAATVETAADTNAAAGLAAGSGDALGVTAEPEALAGLAAASGSALAATVETLVSVEALAGVATGGGATRSATWQATETSALTAPLYGGYRWSSAVIASGNMATSHNGVDQYVVWADDNRDLRIAKRSHGGAWGTAVNLSAVSSTPFPRPYGNNVNTNPDSHNVPVVAVDSNGRVHVAGDMHNQPLRYMRTTNPGDLSSWTIPDPAMTGSNESQVTYPNFVVCSDGTLLFFFRSDGVSGDADWFINTYNHSTNTWSRLAKLLDGKASSHSAYPLHFAVDDDVNVGRVHAIWTWRSGFDVATNEDLCYAYSDDNGATWRDTAGSAYTLPITKATAEVIFEYSGAAQNVINNGGLDVDTAGRPHGGLLIHDGAAFRLHHVWHTGSEWRNNQIGGGNRPVVASASGRVAVANIANTGTSVLRVWDVSHPDAPVSQDVVTSPDLLSLELAVDQVALRERDEVHLVVHPQRANGAEEGDPVDLLAQEDVPTYSITSHANAVALEFNAGLAAASGSAFPATVTTEASTNAPAGLAAAAGSALAATVATAVDAQAGLASAAGSALAATVETEEAVDAQAGLAAGTGSALAATVATESFTNAAAGLAAGTGSAFAASTTVEAHAGLASASGSASQPTVEVGAFTNAAAGLAAASGTAPPASIDITAPAGLAAASGDAQAVTAAFAILADAGLASATGSALGGSIDIEATAAFAAGMGAAFGIATKPPVPPPPLTATGTDERTLAASGTHDERTLAASGVNP